MAGGAPAHEDRLRAHVDDGVGDTLAIDTVRHDLYGTDKDAKTLTAANAVTDEETTIPLGHVPSGLAVDPTTRLVYVALPAAQEILVLSPLS